ncbi:MAG: spore germination protein, partial [Firmicutes bacterium]|nr:spore germination protein [Bacillota bacterium]
ERVDVAVKDLIDGKVVVMIDNAPCVLTVPSVFMDFYQTSDDYVHSFWEASLERMIRLIGLMIGLLLPSLYIALVAVNPNLLPLKLSLSIIGSRASIPFPPLIEVLIMMITIEILREAALRLPKELSQTLGTVGAVVVGTAIVKAGVVSDLMIIIATLTALGLFTAVDYAITVPWRILSWLIVLSSTIFGVYGIILVLLLIVAHLAQLQNLGVPYLSPFGPMRPEDLKDSWLRWPKSQLTHRPYYTHPLKSRKRTKAPRYPSGQKQAGRQRWWQHHES